MKTPPTDNDQVQLQRELANGTSPQSPLGSLSSALSAPTKSLSQVHVLALQTDASLIQATTTLADADSCVDLESNQCHSETLAEDHSDSDGMSSMGDDSLESAATRRLMDIVAASILVVLALGGICGTGHCNVREW
jgi:hypothetical protein